LADTRHDVFISYASEDKLTADAICAELERQAIRCWIAPRDVLAGEEWPAAVVQAIGDSRLLVLVFSRFANESGHVRREVARAADHELPILPFRIENVPPDKSLELFISTPHWLDALTPPMAAHIARLATNVQALMARRARPALAAAIGGLAGGAAIVGEAAAETLPDKPAATVVEPPQTPSRPPPLAPPPGMTDAQAKPPGGDGVVDPNLWNKAAAGGGEGLGKVLKQFVAIILVGLAGFGVFDMFNKVSTGHAQAAAPELAIVIGLLFIAGLVWRS
jgi:hypothetical protein